MAKMKGRTRVILGTKSGKELIKQAMSGKPLTSQNKQILKMIPAPTKYT